MDLLDRIDRALAKGGLDSAVFEECATDLLVEIYPGISPIPGGSDGGRDADIHVSGRKLPIRLLATSTPTTDGVRSNLVSGLVSMKQHMVAVREIVVANPAVLNRSQRDKLQLVAEAYDVRIVAFYDRRFFASRLRRDGVWRHRLLGLSPEPISLSKAPADLAENPWASVAFAERATQLEAVRHAAGDVVVTGKPGVGKTRLVAEVGDIVFVDPHAGLCQICDDLREFTPGLIALDDAGQHLDVLRGLHRLRQRESDLVTFRIIAICWPDEDRALCDVLRGATVVEVPLLERPAIDKIVTEMGVTSLIARTQIVAQAEGRPGWAVALAGMFATQLTWKSLFDGEVLLGEVERFLRQAAVHAGTADLLALIAAVGSTSLGELSRVRATLGLDQSTIKAALTRSAHAGLVDVVAGRDGGRTYRVRPKMLADVLVASRVFRTDVPPFALLDLVDEWPDRVAELARAAVDSVPLGVVEAIPVARNLMQTTRRNGAYTGELLKHYAMMDNYAGRETLGWIRSDFANAHAGYGLTDAVDTVSLILREQRSSDAAGLLLDLALRYRGSLNRSDDPLSKLDEAVRYFHPEIPSASEQVRGVVSARLDTWISKAGDEPRAWDVYGATLQTVLGFRKQAAIGSAADSNTFSLYERL